MNVMDEILAELKSIRAALENGTAKTATAKPAETAKPATKPATAKGPTLEEVQDTIRTLAEQDGMKDKIKEAITKLGGKRAGDFESDPVKLGKLMTMLTALNDAGDDATSDDDDLL